MKGFLGWNCEILICRTVASWLTSLLLKFKITGELFFIDRLINNRRECESILTCLALEFGSESYYQLKTTLHYLKTTQLADLWFALKHWLFARSTYLKVESGHWRPLANECAVKWHIYMHQHGVQRGSKQLFYHISKYYFNVRISYRNPILDVPVKNHLALPKNDTIGWSLIGSKTLIICPIDVLEGGIGPLKIFTERMRR